MVGAPLVEKRKQIIDSSKKILLMTTKNRKKFICYLFFQKREAPKEKMISKKKVEKKWIEKINGILGLLGIFFCFVLVFGTCSLQVFQVRKPQSIVTTRKS